jgi:DnaD/phage-associated family protein
MSGLIMGLVWELPIAGDFGRAEKYVLLAYSDHSDQNGKNVYPSVDLVALKTGYQERAVQLTTRTLEGLGFLVPDGIGPHGTNRYRIPVERTEGGVKIAPLMPAKMLENAPEGNAPEEIAPEPIVVVKDSTTTTTTGADFGKNEQEEQPAEKPNIFRLYESNIGPLTPLLADELRDAEKEYPSPWVEYAFAEAVTNNKRNWRYISAILKRIKVEGFDDGKPIHRSGEKNNRKKQTFTDAREELAAWVAEA